MNIIAKENGSKTQDEVNGNQLATAEVIKMLKKETGRTKFTLNDVSNYVEIIKQARAERAEREKL